MRVTKDTVKHNQIAEQIIAIGDKYKVNSYDILFDLYNFFRNKGKSLDADNKTLEALRKSDPTRYWIERDQWHRQRAVFDGISNTELYKALQTKQPLEAVEEVCKMLHPSGTSTLWPLIVMRGMGIPLMTGRGLSQAARSWVLQAAGEKTGRGSIVTDRSFFC